MAIVEPNDTISNANDSGLSSPGNSAVLNGSIESTTDVDLIKFQLDQGDVVTLNIEAQENGSGLDSILRVFDSAGSELAVNDDSSGVFENFSLDSYLTYTAASAGDYYVGVSDFPNFSYDPNVENSGDGGGSTGDYDLAISIFNGITGTDSSNRLTGTGESDYITGLAGNDSLSGGGQKDNLLGDAGNDFIVGGDGDDLLRGGEGNDVLRGENGNDILGGEAGNDALYGGQGSDIFVIGDGRDNIFDFADGSDQILLTNGLTFENLTITSSTSGGTGTTISSGGSVIANLTGVSPDVITSDDFSFSEAIPSNFRAADADKGSLA
ncbi:MAG: calcium-binding protein [Waterburya sp.]